MGKPSTQANLLQRCKLCSGSASPPLRMRSNSFYSLEHLKLQNISNWRCCWGRTHNRLKTFFLGIVSRSLSQYLSFRINLCHRAGQSVGQMKEPLGRLVHVHVIVGLNPQCIDVVPSVVVLCNVIIDRQLIPIIFQLESFAVVTIAKHLWCIVFCGWVFMYCRHEYSRIKF